MSTIEIPVMDHTLGRYWNQPAGLRDRVLIDDTHAVLPAADFAALPEYSTTIPSGVYPGKVWRRRAPTWLLCWYGPDVGGKCEIMFREALQT